MKITTLFYLSIYSRCGVPRILGSHDIPCVLTNSTKRKKICSPVQNGLSEKAVKSKGVAKKWL